MRLCWADRLAVLWAAIIYFGLFTIASDKAGMLALLFGADGLTIIAYYVLPIWVILRLIDWIAGGPARRRGEVTVRLER